MKALSFEKRSKFLSEIERLSKVILDQNSQGMVAHFATLHTRTLLNILDNDLRGYKYIEIKEQN